MATTGSNSRSRASVASPSGCPPIDFAQGEVAGARSATSRFIGLGSVRGCGGGADVSKTMLLAKGGSVILGSEVN